MNILIIISLSFSFGLTLKIADLLNEHGLKLFRGANFLFGFLWGMAGSYLITTNFMIANIYIALLLSYVFRAKIDYINHGIGFCTMFFTFFYQLDKGIIHINWIVILLFFLTFIFTGLIHDLLIKNTKCNRLLSEILHSGISYVVMPFIYSLILKSFIIFYSLFIFIIGYELARFLGNKAINFQESKG